MWTHTSQITDYVADEFEAPWPASATSRTIAANLTLLSESVSHNWLYFVVVVAVDKWEAAFCFPLIHSLFSSVARRQLAIAAVLRFQSCSNCVGLT
jgi:hypothetical protein